MGDSECIVVVTVKCAGADEHHVEASLEDKVNPAEKEKVEGRKATTTGDGTNDLFVSLVVDVGTVTSDGVETVRETVDTMTVVDDSCEAAMSKSSVNVTTKWTYKNHRNTAGTNLGSTSSGAIGTA